MTLILGNEISDKGSVIMLKIMLLMRMTMRMMMYETKEGLRLSGTVIMQEMDRTLAPTLLCRPTLVSCNQNEQL